MLIVCADFGGIHKSTASRLIHKVSRAIAGLHTKYINFPNTQEEKDEVHQGFFNIAKVPRCIGALDCTHIKIRNPGGSDAELYRNRKQFFSFNVQAICDSSLAFQNIVVRWPGSSHDSTIFNNSNICAKFERGDFGDSILLGDSGYALRSYLITKFLNPSSPAETLFNEAIIRTRNTVERSFGVWKRRFPILALGINVKTDRVEAIVVATAVLNNICIHLNVALPRVTVELQKSIDMTIFNQYNNEVNRRQRQHNITRDMLVNYFSSMI